MGAVELGEEERGENRGHSVEHFMVQLCFRIFFVVQMLPYAIFTNAL